MSRIMSWVYYPPGEDRWRLTPFNLDGIDGSVRYKFVLNIDHAIIEIPFTVMRMRTSFQTWTTHIPGNFSRYVSNFTLPSIKFFDEWNKYHRMKNPIDKFKSVISNYQDFCINCDEHGIKLVSPSPKYLKDHIKNYIDDPGYISVRINREATAIASNAYVASNTSYRLYLI